MLTLLCKTCILSVVREEVPNEGTGEDVPLERIFEQARFLEGAIVSITHF